MGGQARSLGRGLGASLRASDAARASWTQYLQKAKGARVRGQLGRGVWQWVSTRESSLSPNGLELIRKVRAAGVGTEHDKKHNGSAGGLCVEFKRTRRTRRNRFRSSSPNRVGPRDRADACEKRGKDMKSAVCAVVVMVDACNAAMCNARTL